MSTLSRNPENNKIFERSRPLLGTLVSVRVQAKSVIAESAIKQAFVCINDVHQKMSFHQQDSELSLINREAFTRAQRVSPELYRVLSASLALARASEGKFDPTVAGRLVSWGKLPAPSDLKNVLVGNWQDVMLLPNACVQFRRPLWIDLGGIAKGYAIDQAICALKKMAVEAGVVNAGGDLRVFGSMETIHVRDPADTTRAIPILHLRDAAVASSAGYFSEENGNTALIDPHSGTSIGHDVSVTVVARRALWADALTKIVMISPLTAAPILQRLKASALIVHKNGTRHKVN